MITTNNMNNNQCHYLENLILLYCHVIHYHGHGFQRLQTINMSRHPLSWSWLSVITNHKYVMHMLYTSTYNYTIFK